MAGNKLGFTGVSYFTPLNGVTWAPTYSWYGARLEPVEIVKHHKDWSLKNLSNVHIEVEVTYTPEKHDN